MTNPGNAHCHIFPQQGDEQADQRQGEGMGIAGIGHIIQSTSVFGPFLYGVGVLLLKPFGLHHILLAMVRFTPAGGIEMVNGQEVAGALNIFYAEGTGTQSALKYP